MADEHRKHTLDRRKFLKHAAWICPGLAATSPAWAVLFGHRRFSGGAAVAQDWKPKGKRPKGKYDLVIAEGKDPAKMVEKALDAIGALQGFFAKGDNVLVKPNVGWDRSPEQAANTNPEVVATLVKLALKAGAKSVTVADNTCNSARKTFDRSGIKKAAEDAGAKVVLLGGRNFTTVKIPGREITEWEAYADYPTFDKVVNVPIAKHHSLSGLTLSMKNYFGMVGGRRNQLHQKINDTIADLAAFFVSLRPTLTVLDACRILTRNGPQGGRLGDVEEKNTIAVGYAPATIDTFGATLFNKTPGNVRHIQTGSDRGLGSTDLKRAKVKRFKA